MTKFADKKEKDKIIPGSIKLKDILQEKEKEFNLKDDLFGMTLLTNPGYISSSRNIMFTSHLRQFVNLLHPDFPKIFTNYENIVGKYSTGYYKAKNNLKIIDKICKFHDNNNDDHIYLLFTYDKENDFYDVIQKRIVEDLTEKFGFEYNNEGMDERDIGDKINEGEVLYKTTSYDDDMNYCYGKNVKILYLLENYTIEDAIICSRSFADKNMCSKEVETVKVSLNDNDILCNLYGNNDEYKCFPDINEYVKDKILCAKRRIHNNQLLYDLKKSNLKKINYMSDILSFIEGRVVDINIYCNKPLDEIEDNNFNKQLLKYLKMQKEFYIKVYERCKQIIESGSKYSKEVNFYFQKAKNILDDNYKWKEEDNSVFSNMVLEFLVERTIGLSVGQKITGRYGNKGVISKILPDEEMPYLETGERIDVILNTLAPINRLISFSLYEPSLNFISNRMREKFNNISSLKEKEDILFKYIGILNDEQIEKLKDYYKKLSKDKKELFFQDIIEMEYLFI
jgi:DNA-directed RNA polymerase beta subunit